MIIGNKDKFGFELSIKSIEDHQCELKLYIDGNNICAFKTADDSRYRTIRWDLDDLMCYLESTIGFVYNDQNFPFDLQGECAAELDNSSRDYDDSDEEKVSIYYDTLNNWSYNHSWHHAGAGAILPDVFFRKVDEGIEVSWWSDQEDEGIVFKYSYGFKIIECDEYESVITDVVKAYNDLWL